MHELKGVSTEEQAEHLKSAVDKVAASFAEMSARMKEATDKISKAVKTPPSKAAAAKLTPRQREARKDARKRAKNSRKLNRR